MATTTTKLKLIKPAQTDFYNIDDHNANSDKIDAYAVATDAELVTLRATDTSQDTEITGIKTAATALTLRVTNTEAKNTTQDTNIGNLQAETVKLRTDFIAADDLIKTQLTTAYKAADTVLVNDLTAAYKAADTVLVNDLTAAYKAADVVVTNAYKAADTALSTKLTTAYVAADKVITDKAQMYKITTDSGGAKYTFAIVDIKAEALRLATSNTELQTFYANTTVTGFPYTTHWSGTFKRYGDMVSITAHDWAGNYAHTVYNSSGSTWSAWSVFATDAELATKADISKAQMVKVTDDTGGSIYEATSGSLTDFIKGLPLGFHTVFISNSVTGRPPGSTDLRGVIFKIGSNTATYVYGVNVIWLYGSNAGGVASNWSGQLYGGGEPNEAQWNFLKDSKNASFGGTTVPGNTLGADGDVYVQYI